MVLLQQPADNIVKGAGVRNVELRGLIVPFHGGVAADAGAGAAAYLGDTAVQQHAPHPGRFPGGNYHSGVRNGDSENGHQLVEDVVRQGVLEVFHGDVICRANARDADGVGAHSEPGLQMLRVHEHANKLVTVAAEAEENAYSNIVTAAFLGAVHGLRVPVVIALGAGGVQFFVVLFIVGLLEKDICADACGLQFTETLHVRRCDVYVDAADGVAAFVYAVDGLDGLKDVLQRIVHGVFSGLDCKALVAHVYESADLIGNLLLGKLLAGDCAVLIVVWAVNAPVHAIVRKIQRGKQHYAVAIEFMLDFLCKGKQALFKGGVVAVHEDCRLPVRKSFAKGSLFKYSLDAGLVL